MQTLTVSQRLQAYKWALENFRTDQYGPFVCLMVELWYEHQFGEMVDANKLFPELMKHERKVEPGNDGGWFPCNASGNAQREALLRECIRECEGMLEVTK